MLCIIYVSGDIGGSVLGALTGELGVDDGMLFGMRFLPCRSVWSFMAQWCVWVWHEMEDFWTSIGFYCVCVCVCVCVSHSHPERGSTCVSWVLRPACFDIDNFLTGVCVIGLVYWNGQLSHTCWTATRLLEASRRHEEPWATLRSDIQHTGQEGEYPTQV